jgi:hypothetical protein
MTKETFFSLLMTFSWRCVWSLCGRWYYRSWFMKKADCYVTLFYLTFGGVQCGCDTLTWVSSLSYQYSWGSKSPPEASVRLIQIHVHRPFLEYSQHSQEAFYIVYHEKEFIRRKPTWCSLSTMSPNIDEWRAVTWWHFTSYRLGSTQAMMIWLLSVHPNWHWWTSQLMI